MSTLYVSDLDGTLLRDNAIISSFSKKILYELLNEGLQFTVASARSVVSMQAILKDLNLRLPIIEFNGAFISDLNSGRHEIINSICPSIVESIYKLILEFGCIPFVSSFNGNEDCVYYKDVINDGMRWHINDRAMKAGVDFIHASYGFGYVESANLKSAASFSEVVDIVLTLINPPSVAIENITTSL